MAACQDNTPPFLCFKGVRFNDGFIQSNQLQPLESGGHPPSSPTQRDRGAWLHAKPTRLCFCASWGLASTMASSNRTSFNRLSLVATRHQAQLRETEAHGCMPRQHASVSVLQGASLQRWLHPIEPALTA